MNWGDKNWEAEKRELFDAWMSAIFDHADSPVDWRWELGNDVEVLVPLDDETTLEFMQRLFRHSGYLLETNSDQQVAWGIEYVYNSSFSNYMFVISESKVPLEDRRGVLDALFHVFHDVFESRCLHEMGSRHEGNTEINRVCYMFWETCPAGFPLFDKNCDPKYAAAVLNLMERCLSLKNPACVESALHGLGHLAMYGGPARQIIENYIRNNPKADIALLNYAEAAKTGCIN